MSNSSDSRLCPQLYDFQEEAIAQLLTGKRIIVSKMGSGKTAMAVKWAERKCEETEKEKLLIITTASKSRTNDFRDEFDVWCGLDFIKRLRVFSIISWHKLAKWVNQNWNDLENYVFIFDEVQKAKAGLDSQMGRAFLKIAHKNKDWAGFTGTPGDTWLSFYPYFIACNLIRNKTSFLAQYANVDIRFGYPKIIGWRREDDLREMWLRISYAPDTQKVMEELPPETNQHEVFKRPIAYSELLKTRRNSYGDFLDTPMALCSELRRVCFTKDKQQWITDFVESLNDGCVFYYNFVATGDKLEELLQKALSENARIWRIDGKHHEIPTGQSFHSQDVVLCQWQSGSEALNLQFLNYWVSVEPNYSYSITEQAKGRIRRIGQNRSQFYYYLQTEETIESDIYECLGEKREFSEENWCLSNNLFEKGENHE